MTGYARLIDEQAYAQWVKDTTELAYKEREKELAQPQEPDPYMWWMMQEDGMINVVTWEQFLLYREYSDDLEYKIESEPNWNNEVEMFEAEQEEKSAVNLNDASKSERIADELENNAWWAMLEPGDRHDERRQRTKRVKSRQKTFAKLVGINPDKAWGVEQYRRGSRFSTYGKQKHYYYQPARQAIDEQLDDQWVSQLEDQAELMDWWDDDCRDDWGWDDDVLTKEEIEDEYWRERDHHFRELIMECDYNIDYA